MAPQHKKEFIICKVKYVPFAVPKGEFTVERDLDSMRLINFAEGLIWFLGVVEKERAKLSPGSRPRYVEWSFKSNNSELLTINGIRYDEIYVVLGGENLHWHFHALGSGRTMQGSQDLEVSYCTCCFNLQYLNVIYAIKNYVTRQT